jgi:hypothetical protein
MSTYVSIQVAAANGFYTGGCGKRSEVLGYQVLAHNQNSYDISAVFIV